MEEETSKRKNTSSQSKSNATRIKALFKIERKLLRRKQRLVEFKQPIIQLMKKTGEVDFYENATKGEWEFTNSNDEKRKIMLDPRQLLTFNYGDTCFKGYIVFEEEKVPYPHNPLIIAEQWDIWSDKMLNDIRRHKASEYTSIGGMWKNILIGVAIIIGVIALAGLFGVNMADIFSRTEVIEPIKENITQTARNITDIVLG